MILTVTPNPALDLTYLVDAVRLHGEHRVREVRAAAGGKGVNVARVLAQLGTPVTCAGPLGGATGGELRDLLGAVSGVSQSWTPIAGVTRRTVTVVDPGGATGFNEPGPAVAPAELTALREGLLTLLTGTDPRIAAVTISGSLPPGIGGANLAELVRLVLAYDRPVLVDTSGPALLAAARAGATVLKPNAAEAMEATGADTPLEAAAKLAERGARVVVCSLGPDGMLALERSPGDSAAGSARRPGASAPSPSDSAPPLRAWRARLPEPLSGNPTGAGDSLVAVLAQRLLAGDADLPSALVRAVAVSASAVTRPVAGEVDLELAAQLEQAVEIEEIQCP